MKSDIDFELTNLCDALRFFFYFIFPFVDIPNSIILS